VSGSTYDFALDHRHLSAEARRVGSSLVACWSAANDDKLMSHMLRLQAT
jgi:hypothetical protein